jgi:outer membrane protein OmpA-like peptidoglycan-associated protein
VSTNQEDPQAEAKGRLETRFKSVDAAWRKLAEEGSVDALAQDGGNAEQLRRDFIAVGSGPSEPEPGRPTRFGRVIVQNWLEAAVALWLLVLGGALFRPGPDANAPAAGADLDAVADGPLSSAQMERLSSDLRSLLGSDDTASVRHRVARLMDGVLPPLLEELELVRVLVDHTMGRPAAEDSVAAAVMTQWIQRERSRDRSPGNAEAELVVRFAARSADLPPAALQGAAALPLEADRLYALVGSADRGGETDGDASLPRRRAEAVAEVLLARNVPAGHVVVLTRPAIAGPVPTASGVAEPENRRVEVWVR